MGVSYSWACRGVACAFLCAVLCYLSSASWSALVANVGAAAVVTTLFFDVAVLGSVVLAIVGMITSAGIIAALLLGIWGEELVANLQRMGASAFKSALCVLPIAAVWVYTMVQLEALSVRWGVFLCLLATGCAAVTVIAGQIFTLVIVRVLILPACLPGKVFSMLTGMPEDALDQCRETMTTQHNWEPLAVTPAEDGAQVDAMIWEGYADKSGGSEGRKSRRRWVIWFLGNGARYEECHQEMEEYAQDLGVSVCAFNYRGVGRSSGLAWKFEDLVTDGNLVLQALCERMQLTPSEVLLHGHSLGGAVSALVRVENPGAALINDRSFGALSEVPVAWARQLSNHAGDPLPTAVLDAVCALIPYLMTTMGWAVPVNEQWQSAPEVVSRTIILYHKDDEILPYERCSFHLAYLRSLGVASSGSTAAEAAAAEAAAQERTGVRCVELKLHQPARQAAAHGDSDHVDDRRGSPHNEWICGLPSWQHVAPMIRAALQDNAD